MSEWEALIGTRLLADTQRICEAQITFWHGRRKPAFDRYVFLLNAVDVSGYFADAELDFARRYEHRDGLMSFHINFAVLWLANPLYLLLFKRPFYAPERGDQVTILIKLPISSIPVQS